MKVLITTDLFATKTNGVVTSIKNLMVELTKNGHEVRILTMSGDYKSHKKQNVYYIKSVPFKIYPNVRVPISLEHKLIREIIDWKPDIIHSQCEFFSLQFALHISKVTNAPIVHTYHTLYEQYVHYLMPGKRLGKFVVKDVSKKRLKGVRAIIAPTLKVKRALNTYGIYDDIYVIPSGIDLEQHKNRISESMRHELRECYGISDEDRVLINLGRLGDEKNLEELVEYFKELTLRVKNTKFLLVGDGPAKKKLMELAKELKIEDKVIFTGMVEPQEVQKYYQIGDIFVSASTSETQGLTYVEAAANGLPLICRSDLCLKGIIYEGENGYEYTCKNDFVQKMSLALENDGWRKKAGEKSREIAKGYDKEVFGQSMIALYNELLQ